MPNIIMFLKDSGNCIRNADFLQIREQPNPDAARCSASPGCFSPQMFSLINRIFHETTWTHVFSCQQRPVITLEVHIGDHLLAASLGDSVVHFPPTARFIAGRSLIHFVHAAYHFLGVVEGLLVTALLQLLCLVY